MPKSPIFKTSRNTASRDFIRPSYKRKRMGIRKRIATWIYPEAFGETETWDDLVRESDTPRGDPTLSFKIYNTSDGNKIVEFYAYDSISDRSNSDLYVITSDEDYGQALARIAMLKKLSS